MAAEWPALVAGARIVAYRRTRPGAAAARRRIVNSMTTTSVVASQVADPAHGVQAARRQLTLYFTLLVIGSSALEWTIIRTGEPIQRHIGLAITLMWVPALASFVARLVFREGIADVSFHLRGRATWRAIGVAVAFPIVVGTVAYGSAWASGLVGFSPAVPRIRMLGQLLAPQDPLGRFLIYLGLAATLGTVIGVTSAAGEEIGWRGYMLARLLRAGVPSPVFVSGLIWALWHVPLIVTGVYAAGPHPLVSAALFVVMVVSLGLAIGALRLATGSVWPAIAMHAAWNAIIQGPFDRASTGPGATVWVGESGILVALVTVVCGIVVYRWWGNGRFTGVPGTRDPELALQLP